MQNREGGLMKKLSDMEIVVEMKSGSHVYGTNTPESDLDLRGVCIGPPKVIFSIFKNFEQYQGQKGEDRIIYDIRKFFALCSKCNPNIVEQLYTPPEFWITVTPLWEKILENKHLFISKAAKNSFSGYAHAQLKKLRSHHKWLRDIPVKPDPEKYGVDVHKLSKTQADAIKHMPVEVFKEEYVEFARNYKRYQQDLKEWNDYDNHMKQRNPARLALEKAHGFDSKFGYHLIRLYHEAVELLKTGAITLPRPEKDLLMDIRQGKYSLEELIEIGEKLDKELDGLYETSTLPWGPDKNGIDEFYYSIIMERI